ncbi:hypothetical protein HS125_06710 [bacterium]|nr:hypothetical protein [bacterium]
MTRAATTQRLVRFPQIDGEWWPVAGNPMDHKYATADQEPVDFGIWQAADGTWQIWSCLRRTTAGRDQGGKGRVFYRWEGQSLFDTDWKPMGIAQEARVDLGETAGGQQAPHVIRVGDTYHMFYGDWENICHSVSRDGKHFERVIGSDGTAKVFSEGPGFNTRDVCMLLHDGLWYCYYTCHPNNQGMVMVRTSRDLESWSDSKVVAFGGQAGTSLGSMECPHVVKLGEDEFYLLTTQSYGDFSDGQIRKRGKPQTSVYGSSDPTYFGINQDAKYWLGHLPVAAPELVFYQGQWYLAALNEGALDGIRIARLKWVEAQPSPRTVG